MTGPAIIADERHAPAGWDERAVHAPGGHVMQSSTWAAYRERQGLAPRFLTFEDGHVALAVLQRSPLTPGVEAIVRRGPAHAFEDPLAAAGHASALAAWARGLGARELYLDPERPVDAAYEAAMERTGFEITEGLDPSIHVMRLAFEAGLDEDALLARCSKSTRQRIRAAERAGTLVVEDRIGDRLDEFVGLMRERAAVLGIRLQRGHDYLEGWRALLGAGLARLLVAEHDGQVVGGLFLFRQGGIHATAYSADDAATRTDLPGTMHLVRWTAIRDAFREGASAIELGGVDLPGQRQPPGPGEPGHGLYEHKRSFGATWVERSAPRRIILRPHAERLARGRRRLVGILRGVRR